MATGRTTTRWSRVYADGYDISGYSRAIGPLEVTFEEADLTTMADPVKGYLRNHAQVNVGTLDAVFDNTATSGLHAVLSSPASRNVLVAKGIRGVPADGDPCFAGYFMQGAYQIAEDGMAVTANIPFTGWAADASTLQYAGPWGTLLHANASATADNSAGAGFDNPIAGATAKGGYFVYQILGGDAGTVTLSVDDSADNSSFTALSGATSGSVAASAGVSGIVAIGNGATVRRYLRWQLAFGTAATVTFVSAFMRAF